LKQAAATAAASRNEPNQGDDACAGRATHRQGKTHPRRKPADGVNDVVGCKQRAIQPRERTAKRNGEGRCADRDEDLANQKSKAIGHQLAIMSRVGLLPNGG
jgi:hypothetical protein